MIILLLDVHPNNAFTFIYSHLSPFFMIYDIILKDTALEITISYPEILSRATIQRWYPEILSRASLSLARI